MSDPLNPSPALLAKLSAVCVHYEELNSPGGHPSDRAALEGALNAPDVQEWLEQMTEMTLAPVKRESCR